ncbi:hypothetical protein ACFQET_08765 [Levilactobacillus tangyuanensis]|uniref:Uncharacterized protein n=1 Tax=Levilactobacillus tangyuanensis TaxID=2486021 RepID=A0ABW1TS49_9LACO|nr:hypothetical protein [Levilactobacillus tangyuanensis]
MTEDINDVLAQGNDGAAGVPTTAPVAPSNPEPETSVEAQSTTEVAKKEDKHPDILNAAPTIMRKKTENVGVDEKFNLKYVLKNGKELKISVVKPDLGVSTRLSDAQIRFNETDSGERYMMVNNMAVYEMVMTDIIRIILVDGAPLHSISFDSLSKIGVTKSELDDLMSIIETFYLEE